MKKKMYNVKSIVQYKKINLIDNIEEKDNSLINKCFSIIKLVWPFDRTLSNLFGRDKKLIFPKSTVVSSKF